MSKKKTMNSSNISQFLEKRLNFEVFKTGLKFFKLEYFQHPYNSSLSLCWFVCVCVFVLVCLCECVCVQ